LILLGVRHALDTIRPDSNLLVEVVFLATMTETASAAPEPPEPEAESWFEAYAEPYFDRCIRTFEFLTVAGLAIAIGAGAIYEVAWVLWGHDPQLRQSRMHSALDMLNGRSDSFY
jgi:hypothetical protein